MINKLKILIIVLFVSLTSQAQDPQLFENDWYLHNLIINGEDNIPPVNDEIPYILTHFTPEGILETGMCESGGAGELSYNGDTEFKLHFMAWLTGGCYQNEPFNEMNNWLFQSFWGFSSDIVFNYEIINDGQHKTLIITNPENNIAVFGDDLLLLPTIYESAFFLYPNPVNNVLHIETNNAIEITTIHIYDVFGRLVFKDYNPTNLLDISILDNGLLFLQIETELELTIKKVIKN